MRTDVSSTVFVERLGTKSENLDIIANNVMNKVIFGANFGLRIQGCAVSGPKALVCASRCSLR